MQGLRKYEGRYVHNKKDGHGVYYNADGTVQGKVIEGVLQGQKPIDVKSREYMEDGKSMIEIETAEGEGEEEGME